MIQVEHPTKFKKPRFISNMGRFTGRVADARRFGTREEARSVALSMLTIWRSDGYTFTVLP
jgi:hypothetical protein